MRFDLEISNLHTDLVYISENQEIPAGAIPLYFINMDTRDKVPSDFFSIENNILQDSLAGQGYQAVEGPAFPVNSNKFLLTHVSTYSVQGNAKVPLFYKHVIADKVHEDAIRVVDFFGIQVPREEYLVEEKKEFTNLYINKYNKILFVEYVSENRIYKKLLDLQPIFNEIGWEDFVILDTNVPEYKYMNTDNFIQTSYPGTLYISYKYETDLLRMPTCNIEDDWYLSILNANFTIEKLIPNLNYTAEFKYSVPEYYVQQIGNDRYYKHFEHKKARKLFDNYIQLQTAILRERAESIYIYVYDFYTNILKYAVTTNHSLNGKLVPKDKIPAGYVYTNDIYYTYTDNWNGDGIIGLPVKMTDNDVAYVTYSIYDEYYEFRFLNLNSPTLNGGGYFAIYLLPDVTELEEAVYFARIGLPRTEPLYDDGQLIFVQDMQFETLSEYEQFADENNLYTVAVISIFGNYAATVLNTKDARVTGGEIIDRKLACQTTADMFYKDLIDGNISIPTNDTLIATLDADALLYREVLKMNEAGTDIDIESKEFLTKAKSTIQTNLDASSMPILDVAYTYTKPAGNVIETADINTTPGWENPPAPILDTVNLAFSMDSAVRAGHPVIRFINNTNGTPEVIAAGENPSTSAGIPYINGTHLTMTITFDWWFNSVTINSGTPTERIITVGSNTQQEIIDVVINGDTTFTFDFGD